MKIVLSTAESLFVEKDLANGFGIICWEMLRFERERVIDGLSFDTARSETTERDSEDNMVLKKIKRHCSKKKRSKW